MPREATPDAQNYAAQATSMRALAARASSIEVKGQLLRLADLYDKLAQVADDFVLRSLSAAAAIATSSAPTSAPPKQDGEPFADSTTRSSVQSTGEATRIGSHRQ